MIKPKKLTHVHAANYMLKVNNRNTRPRCKYVVRVSLLLTLNKFHPCSGVSILNFEQVNANWGTF